MIPVYWINLDENIDRRNNMLNIFLLEKVLNRRIKAIKNEKPMLGCCLSHIKAIHTAWIDGNELAVICEDDADFSNSKNIYSNINMMLNTIPIEVKNDWDIIQIQYTEPSFSKGINEYIKCNNMSSIKNRLIKGYLYGAVAYLINRKGMIKFLNLFTTINKNDINEYIVTASFDHPRAGSEELIYRYVNTYVSVFPIINYTTNISTINNKEHYAINNEINRLFSSDTISIVNNDNYKIIQNKRIYSLSFDLHWFNGGKEEVDEVINDIFNNY